MKGTKMQQREMKEKKRGDVVHALRVEIYLCTRSLTL